MSVEQNKAIVRRVWEELSNQRNLSLIDELYADDHVFHVHLPSTEVVSGLDALKQGLTTFFTAFPDLHYAIEDMVAE